MLIKMIKTVYPCGGDIAKQGTALWQGGTYQAERIGQVVIAHCGNGEIIQVDENEFEEELYNGFNKNT